MKTILKILTFALLLIASTHITATEPDDAPQPSNLMRLLEKVPNLPIFKENMLGFADLYAARATRPDAVPFKNWAEFQDSGNASDQTRHWVNSLPVTLGGYRNYLLQWDHALGFDWFQIQQVLTLDAPPTILDIFYGDFDAAAIETAITDNLAFVPVDRDGVPMWCGDDTCDGMKVDLMARNVGNPFGGWLGRKHPMIFDDSHIISTTQADLLAQIVTLATTDAGSLADDPNYQAIDWTIHTYDDAAKLRQLYFIPPAMLSSDLMFMSAEEIEAALAEKAESDGLPGYLSATFADLATADEQILLVVLLYSHEGNAKTAVEVLTQRYETATLNIADELVIASFEARAAHVHPPYIAADAPNDRYPVVLAFHYPQVTPALTAGDRAEAANLRSGLLYEHALNLLYRSDWTLITID